MTARQAQPIHQQLAKASWLAPVLYLGAVFILRQSQEGGSGVKPMGSVIAVLAVVFALVGVLSGIVALTGISRHGKEGILVPSLIGLVLSSIFTVVVFTYILPGSRSAGDPQAEVEALARDLQSQGLPLKVDEETELIAVTALPGQLAYSYRLVNYRRDQVDRPAFTDAMRSVLKTQLCSRLQILWKNDFSCKARYVGSNSAPIAEIVLTASDCAN